MKAIRAGNLIRILDDAGAQVPQMPLFRRFEAGIGWLDPTNQDHFAQNWVIVCAETEGDTIVAFTEASGSLKELMRQCTNLKDLFLVERFHYDGSSYRSEIERALREHEGLSYYRTLRSQAGVISYPTHPSTWPHFRDDRPVASLVPVHEEVYGDLQGGFERLRSMASSGKLIFRNQCPRAQWLIRQKPPYDELYRHPLLQACVFALSSLAQPKPQPVTKQADRPAYPNLTRG